MNRNVDNQSHLKKGRKEGRKESTKNYVLGMRGHEIGQDQRVPTLMARGADEGWDGNITSKIQLSIFLCSPSNGRVRLPILDALTQLGWQRAAVHRQATLPVALAHNLDAGLRDVIHVRPAATSRRNTSCAPTSSSVAP
eukprot:scaffold7360_cov270-Pinguiococcus_pyrenoidosus.AAC.7